MKKLNLNIPEGYEIDLKESDLSTGNICLKKTEKKLPVTNEECVPFLPEDCYYVSNEGAVCLDYSDKVDPNTITSQEYAEAFLALMQLIKFRDIWNEGWIADWTDSNWKYVIYFCNDEIKEEIKSRGRGVLNFKTPEIRDKFSKKFDTLIHQARPLL